MSKNSAPMSRKTPKSLPAKRAKPALAKAAAAPAETPKAAAPAAELKAGLLKTAAPAPVAKPVEIKTAEPKTQAKPEPKAAPAQAPAAQKGKADAMTDTVRNTAKEATDRAQAIFADVNERAKEAVEKGTKLFQEFGELNKGNVEAVVESSRRAAKGAETLAQNAADYARASFERQTAALKSFAAVKSPTEFFQLQSEFARSAFDSLVAETSKNSEVALKIAGDVFQPISNRFAVAAEKLKTAA